MRQGASGTDLNRDDDALATLLRGAGLRCTSPRLAVLGMLAEARQPQSHAEVFAALRPAGLDRATVYRNLQDLASAAIAHRADHGDHVWRFALAEPERRALHFLCVACGEIQALPESAVRLRRTSGTPRSLREGEVAVQVKGRCDGCR